VVGGRALAKSPDPYFNGSLRKLYALYEAGELSEHYRGLLYDAQKVDEGIKAGRLVVDERLRRFLRPDGSVSFEPVQVAQKMANTRTPSDRVVRELRRELLDAVEERGIAELSADVAHLRRKAKLEHRARAALKGDLDSCQGRLDRCLAKLERQRASAERREAKLAQRLAARQRRAPGLRRLAALLRGVSGARRAS
jgi:chromosome segregation ATPase